MLHKIWGFRGCDYEECSLLGYKIPVHTSQGIHYISATHHSRLMLCKIWGFHAGDEEDCCLLGYKHPLHTSQETHYVSATEPNSYCCVLVFRIMTYKALKFIEFEPYRRDRLKSKHDVFAWRSLQTLIPLKKPNIVLQRFRVCKCNIHISFCVF
jgi:hypothetical protein